MLGDPEIGSDRSGCPDQPTNPEEGGVAHLATEGRKGLETQGDKDSRSPQIDRSPGRAHPEPGGSGNQGPDLR